MSDYAAWIMHVNRIDLLDSAVESAKDLWDEMIVIDNSPENGEVIGTRYGNTPTVYRPCVPLSCAQSFNFMFRDTVARGSNICLWMHSDAVAGPESCTKLLKVAQQYNSEHRKWGVLFTNYDALAAINAEAALEVGGCDVNLPQYFTDNCLQRRLRFAGYECIDTNLPVEHLGSQTIRSDAQRAFMNSITFPLYRMYYIAKYGGEPGRESFLTPFNR